MSHDPMSLFQQMWAGATPPLILAPEQLDKKIDELRLVQGWLKLNLQMLDASLGAMEAQRQFRQGFERMGEAVNQSTSKVKEDLDASLKKPMPNPFNAFQPSADLFTEPAPTKASKAAPEVEDLALANIQTWWTQMGEQFLRNLHTPPTTDPATSKESAHKSTATKKPFPKKI